MGGRARLAFSLALVSAACSREDAVRNGVATDDGIAAIALPEEQYRDMLKRLVLGTTSGSVFLVQLGPEDGCELVDEAVDTAVQRNLPQWRVNLIAAYRENVPPAELAEAVQKSPRRARSMLNAYLPAIGNTMKSASEPLLKKSGVEVLEAVGNVALNHKSSAVDRKERNRAIAEVTTSREICGVTRW